MEFRHSANILGMPTKHGFESEKKFLLIIRNTNNRKLRLPQETRM